MPDFAESGHSARAGRNVWVSPRTVIKIHTLLWPLSPLISKVIERRSMPLGKSIPKIKRHKTLRKLSLVKLKEDWAALPTSKKLPFVRARDLPLVFLGEIPNMREHGVFIGHKSGRAYTGYHVFQFEEVPEDET
jgi:hypothetical protein